MPKTKLLVWLPWWKKDPIHGSSESATEDENCECIFCVCQALLEKTGKIHSWFIEGFHKSADARPGSAVQERPRATCVTVVAKKLMWPPRCGNWGTRLPCPAMAGMSTGIWSCFPVLPAPSHPALAHFTLFPCSNTTVAWSTPCSEWFYVHYWEPWG